MCRIRSFDRTPLKITLWFASQILGDGLQPFALRTSLNPNVIRNSKTTRKKKKKKTAGIIAKNYNEPNEENFIKL